MRELSRAIENVNYTQSDWVKRLGIKQSEISALKHRDASRFSVDRLLRLLSRLQQDVTIDVVRAGVGDISVSTRPRTLSELRLASSFDEILTNEPGLVLISGSSTSGRTTVLHAILESHRKHDDVILFSNNESHPKVSTIEFDVDDEIHRREIQRANVIGIDSIGPGKASPYTALWLAENARVYTIIDAPDGKRGLDAFIAQMGPPRFAINSDMVLGKLRAIIALRRYAAADGRGWVLGAEVSRPKPSEKRYSLAVMHSFEEDESRLMAEGRINHQLPRPIQHGPIEDAAQAKLFLDELGRQLSTDFSVSVDDDDSLSLDIDDELTGRRVSVTLTRDRNRRRYDVMMTTEEEDWDIESRGRVPETRVFGAPSDLDYIIRLSRNFFRRAQS